MQGIFAWISKHLHWLVLLLLEVISLALLVSFNDYQGSVWFAGTNRVAGQVQEWEEQSLAYLNLGKINQQLTERNIQLERELEILRGEISQLKHDSTYVERALAAKLEEVPTLPAQLVYNSINLHDNYLTINKGTKHGVDTKMGVVSGTGIVGIISHVAENYSIVMSVLNSKSSISCRLRGSNYFGYLRWQGGSVQYAQLDDVPRHADFEVGDSVETSGFSNVFPSGIFVGTVEQINDSKDGLSYQLIVRLSADLANIRDVAVILKKDDTDVTP